MFNNKDTKRSNSLPEELRQEINQMSDWRMKLHDRYVHVATDPVFSGHPLKEEVQELLQQGIEYLEIGIKSRRDKLAELN